MFKPLYSISDRLVSQLSEISEVKSLVLKSTLSPERESFLRRAAIIKMIHASTSIEGNGLNEYEVAKIVIREEIGDNAKILKKDELQVMGFVAIMGKITSSDVVDILEIPKRTSQSKLKKLEAAGILKKIGAGPTTYYIIPETKVSN